jgi:hypothetical protein
MPQHTMHVYNTTIRVECGECVVTGFARDREGTLEKEWSTRVPAGAVDEETRGEAGRELVVQLEVVALSMVRYLATGK